MTVYSHCVLAASLHSNSNAVFAARHRAVQCVALERHAPSLTDQPLQIGAPPGIDITITLENSQLAGQLPHGPKAPLFPESPAKFFTKQAAFEVEFVPNDKGEITSLVLTQADHKLIATKTK